MIALSTLDLIKENERKLEDKHIIIFIFVKPSDEISQEIISNFNYLHHLSDKHCNIYPIGYSAILWSKSQYNDVTKVHDFLSFKNYIYISILEGLWEQYFLSFALLI